MASAVPNARHFSLPCVPLVPFKLPPCCLSSVGASLSRWVCVWVSQEVLLRAPAASSTDSIPTDFAYRSCGDLSSWHWNPGLGSWCWSGTPHSQNIPPEFLSTQVWGQPVQHPCPSYQSGWMWFLLFCRLPFSLISDVPEWWLFYILGVILMWLYEEASQVFLCHQLDW